MRKVSYRDGIPVYNTGKKNCTKKWNALDPNMCHPFDNDDNDNQEGEQNIKSLQESYESIFIKDSCDVEVTTTDTQAALNVQVGLQAAISLIISISIANSDKADKVSQDLYETIKSSQVNKQQTYVENSRGVKVTTTDSDIAVNAQVLLQVLLALVARLDIL